MAYMNQEKKARLAPAIKAICKKYGVKASIAVRHHSTLVLNIKSSPIDFIGNFNAKTEERWREPWSFTPATHSIDVTPYWYQDHFTGTALDFLSEVIPAMNDGNHDRSDIQSDYFDVGWYIDVNIGKWDKPYELVA